MLSKIAVIHNLPSGGALRVLYEQVRLFEEWGYEVSVYTFSTSDQEFLPKPSITGEYRTEKVAGKGLGQILNYMSASKKLAAHIDSRGFGQVFAAKCMITGSPAILNYLKTPALYYCQEPIRIREYEAAVGIKNNSAGNTSKTLRDFVRRILKLPARQLMKYLDKKSVKKASVVAANSNFSSRWIRDVYGVKPVTVYLGISPFFFKPFSSDRNTSVLQVGRLEPVKGQFFLLECVSLIPKNIRPPVHLVCDAKDALYEKSLIDFSEKNDIDLHIHCRISDEELKQLYCSSRLLAACASNEPFGLTPVEAMACGTPVLALKEGGYCETVRDGECGYLLPRDAGIWAEKISRLLSDEKIWRHFSDNAAVYSKEWTWDRFNQELTKTGFFNEK